MMHANNTIKNYHKVLAKEMPTEIDKYLNIPELERLKRVGYFCGMDYCKGIYDFRFYYSRYDHSVSVARIVWHFTHDLKQTVAALVHDISSPVFSHVIDFLNGDALHQESTEEYTENIILGSKDLMECLKEDKIAVDDIIDYKKYPIADNERPKLSADRLESTLISNLVWNKTLTLRQINNIYQNIKVVENEEGINEMAFKNIETAKRFFDEATNLYKLLASNEDKLCMNMLAEIVRIVMIEDKIVTEDLYKMDEKEMLYFITTSSNEQARLMFNVFSQMKKINRTEIYTDVPNNSCFISNKILKVKKRYIDPLVIIDKKPERLLSIDEDSQKLLDEVDKKGDSQYAYVDLPKVLSKTYKK